MKDLKDIRFNGTFRSYQQGVLDRADEYLEDGKINIVAAPGSGKTILGLELIRRLAAPALILSPSVTIRQQWGERFAQGFLPTDAGFNDYFSFDLHEPGAITSITYQALYAATEKMTCDDDDGKTEDFVSFDLFDTVRTAGIKTICLDEAHHLRREWQKALELFLAQLTDVKLIALTATPPYDSTPAEWERYKRVCGEIDEEIFIPQLVSQQTLCPHQDYVCFSYPSAAESTALKAYRNKALATIDKISGMPEFHMLLSACQAKMADETEFVMDHAHGFAGLFAMASLAGKPFSSKQIKSVILSRRSPKLTTELCDAAMQMIADAPERFVGSETVLKTLTSAGYLKRGKSILCGSEQQQRMLFSSVGKLESIAQIVNAEWRSRGESLRMLVLTDYIKKEMTELIGTNAEMTMIGLVSVFEIVRRTLGSETRVAALSGSLVIVPKTAIAAVQSEAVRQKTQLSFRQIGDCGYSEVAFRGECKTRVSIMTALFERGEINVLIGTKSLLGEGWDSPCINALILASVVGSYMLSNQMRGRAIRTDKSQPEKVSSIWHLVTVEPDSFFKPEKGLERVFQALADRQSIGSADYATLTRRFECFMGPCYTGDGIESGMARLDIIKPPYTEEHIADINAEMFRRAADLESVRRKWQSENVNSKFMEVCDCCELPRHDAPVPRQTLFFNFMLIILFAVFQGLIIGFCTTNIIRFANGGIIWIIAAVSAAIVTAVILQFLLRILMRFLTPKRMINTLGRAVLFALQELGEIKSNAAKVETEALDYDGIVLSVSLRNASVREQGVFNTALTEMLSQIRNPRYVIMKRNILLSYSHSFACPTVFGENTKKANILIKALNRYAGRYEAIFTRNEKGRKTLINCRRYSFVNRNEDIVTRKKKVKKNLY